jgi:hypothetical protein
MYFPLLKKMNSAIMIFKLFGKSKVPKGDINVMKRTLFLSILIVFFTTTFMFVVGCNNNQDQKKLKEEYDLQERCGKQSEEIFKEKYHSRDEVVVRTDIGFNVYQHSNHYNKKTNKCFQLIIVDFRNEKGGPIAITKELFDINENRKYGFFWNVSEPNKILNCYVSNNKCNSKQEWDSLVKPFMEE